MNPIYDMSIMPTPPNTVIEANNFYISYNSRDSKIYGSDTTALVDEKTQQFYILNGDHRKSYSALLIKGFGACFDYFKSNAGQRNKYSEKE